MTRLRHQYQEKGDVGRYRRQSRYAIARQFCALNYLAAAVISFLVGALIAYIVSIKIAFEERRLQNRRAEFVWFVAIGTVGLAINVGKMVLAVQLLSLSYLLAKCVAAGFTFLGNFIARRQLLFVVGSPPGNPH